MFAPATGENTEKVVFVFYDRREDPGSRMGRKETVFQTGEVLFPTLESVYASSINRTYFQIFSPWPSALDLHAL